MDSLHGYTVLDRITDNIWLISDGIEEFIAKNIDSNSIDEEVRIGLLMAVNNIGPQIYQVERGLIIMEKLDGNLNQLIPFIGVEFRQRIQDYIDGLIRRMHRLDIAHGDLHSENIGYKEVDGVIRLSIIDYGKSFHISSGRSDPEVIQWMIQGFGWEDTYEDFVNYDFENWKMRFDDVLPPVDSLFDEVLEDVDSGHLAIALSEKSGWPIFAISMRDNEDNELSIPFNCVVRAPGGEMFVDITGLRTRDYLERYWFDYAIGEGYENFTIVIHEADEVLCDIYHYNEIQEKIANGETDNVNSVASTIWDILEQMMYTTRTRIITLS